MRPPTPLDDIILRAVMNFLLLFLLLFFCRGCCFFLSLFVLSSVSFFFFFVILLVRLSFVPLGAKLALAGRQQRQAEPDERG